MSNIPLPERGQPLDVTYINQMAIAINNLASIATTTSNKTITLANNPSGPLQLGINEVRILASYVSVPVTSATLGQEQVFAINYPGSLQFKTPPIIIATPVNINNTPAGKNVAVVLNDITASGAQGTVKFNSSGDLAIGVNLLIIGQLN
ncbi:MAG: hypothetical protein WCI60_03735 [bacterium]